MPSTGADLWSPGWAQPLSASPHTAAAYEDVRLLRCIPPLFGLDSWWGWQEHTLAIILSRDADGTPTYRTVVVIICRQNGKTTLLYCLAWVYLSAGHRILFTLHERQKAREKWEEVAVALTAAVPSRYHVSRRSGSERITDRRTGGFFALVTPDDAGGRSETADVLIVDEAAHISPRFLRAARSTTITRSDAQIILISSGGMVTSGDLGRSRAAAHEQLATPDERSVGIIEYAAKVGAGLGGLDVHDELIWERCIPTLDLPGGARRDALRDELSALDPSDFAREILGVWDGSPTEAPITAGMWDRAAATVMPERADLINVCLGIDASPYQAHASIVVCGVSKTTHHQHAALAATGEGTGWLLEDVQALARKWRPMRIVADAMSPASSIVERLKRTGRSVELTTGPVMARSCAHLVTALASDEMHAVSDDALTVAATTAVRRPLGDTGWAFHRRHGTDTDITPVVALALASFASYNLPTTRKEPPDADQTPDDGAAERSDHDTGVDPGPDPPAPPRPGTR